MVRRFFNFLSTKVMLDMQIKYFRIRFIHSIKWRRRDFSFIFCLNSAFTLKLLLIHLKNVTESAERTIMTNSNKKKNQFLPYVQISYWFLPQFEYYIHGYGVSEFSPILRIVDSFHPEPSSCNSANLDVSFTVNNFSVNLFQECMHVHLQQVK